MSSRRKVKLEISPGDIYEDCAYHPVLCVSIDEEGDEISGISLIDGSTPRSCSLGHCGVRKLTVEQAVRWKHFGPDDLPSDVEFEPGQKWWVKTK
jgi:hypothetical protein